MQITTIRNWVKQNPRIVKVGVALGVLMPMVGLVIGLQASSTVGTLLILPFVVIAIVSGNPVGMFSIISMLLGFVLSIIFYTLLVALVVKVFGK